MMTFLANLAGLATAALIVYSFFAVGPKASEVFNRPRVDVPDPEEEVEWSPTESSAELVEDLRRKRREKPSQTGDGS